jgi:hypothetical protein
VPKVAPYGSWSSPIAAATVARAGRRLGAAAIAEDGAAWWAEGRPDEGGRVALMRRAPGGEPEEATAAGANVRTRVHEYGGGAWCLVEAETIVFVEFGDQRLYRQRLGEEPVAISPEPAAGGALHYADMRPTPDGLGIVCVRETHAEGEPVNEIVRLPLDGSSEPQVLAGGRDLYSFPRVSPDGAWLAWTCWDHPNMPWDGTELWVAPLADSGEERLVAGGAEESIFQPEWGPNGQLYFVSDRDGWWNLYRAREPGAELSGEEGTLVQLTEEEADFAHPQWLFGGATYAFLDSGAVVCVRCRGAEERLFLLRPEGWEPADLGLPFTSFGYPVLAARGDSVAFSAASPESETAVVLHDVERGETEVVRASSEEPVDPAYVSRPRAIEFPTGDGAVAHGFFYPPANPEFEAPEGELPPLVPLLDQPRDRRRRRQLPRQQRLRARVPQRAARDLGRRRHRGLRQRGASPRPAGRGRRGAAGDPRRLGGRLRDPLRADLPRRLRRRGELLRRRRRRGAGARHPQVRVPLPGPADRALSRARRPLQGALADQPRRAAAIAGDPLPGPRGRGSAAEPGGDDGRGAGA